MKAFLVFLSLASIVVEAKSAIDIKEIQCFESLENIQARKPKFFVDNAIFLKEAKSRVFAIPHETEIGYFQYTDKTQLFCRPNADGPFAKAPLAGGLTREIYPTQLETDGESFFIDIVRILNNTTKKSAYPLELKKAAVNKTFVTSKIKAERDMAEPYQNAKCGQKDPEAVNALRRILDARIGKVGDMLLQELRLGEKGSKENKEYYITSLRECGGTVSYQKVNEVISKVTTVTSTPGKMSPNQLFK